MRDAFRETTVRGKTLREREALTEADKREFTACGDKIRRILRTMEEEWSPTRMQVAPRLGKVSESEWAALGKAVGLTPASRATLTKVVDVRERP